MQELMRKTAMLGEHNSGKQFEGGTHPAINREMLLQASSLPKPAGNSGPFSIYRSYSEQERKTRRKHKNKEKIKNRSALQKIKMASGCVDCGYNLHPAALDFDHLVPSEKEL